MDDVETQRVLAEYSREIQRLSAKVDSLQRGQHTPQLAHSSLEEGQALEVRAEDGTVRQRWGWQPDGSVAVVTEGGDPVSAPTAPTVTPSIAGLKVTWDGTLADPDVALPADFDHMAVHVSDSSGFTPDASTYQGTIRRAGEGGTLPVTPLPYVPHYVVLIPVTTGGIQGDPSAEASGTPLQVEGPDLIANSIEAGHIQAGAVTADKLEAILVLASQIVGGTLGAARVELDSDGLRGYDDTDTLIFAVDTTSGNAVFSGDITASEITGSSLLVGDESDEHIWIGDNTFGGHVVRAAGGGARMDMAATAAAAEMRLTPPPSSLGEVFFEGIQYAFVAVGSGFVYPAVAYTSPTTSDIAPAGPSSEVQLEGGSTTVDASRVRHRADVHQFSMGVRTVYSKGVIEVDDDMSIRADSHAPVSQDMLDNPDFATTGSFVDFDPADFPTIAFETGYSGRVKVKIALSGNNNSSANSSLALGFRLSGGSTVGTSLKRCAYARSIGAGTVHTEQAYIEVPLQLASAASYTLTPAYRISTGSAATASYDLALPNFITVEPSL